MPSKQEKLKLSVGVGFGLSGVLSVCWAFCQGGNASLSCMNESLFKNI